MSRELAAATLLRCLTVWSFVTAATAAVPLALQAELRAAGALAGTGADGLPFDALLLAASTVVLTCCAVWFWLVTTLTVGQALAGRASSVRGCPDGVRRLVLATCGLTLMVAASPAAAETPAGSPPGPDQPHVLAGLPYPDRASMPTTTPAPPADTQPAATEPVTVRAGDTLWAIAAGTLPAEAGPADIDSRWRAIWQANRAELGPDPDVIHPGATLRLPIAKES